TLAFGAPWVSVRLGHRRVDDVHASRLRPPDDSYPADARRDEASRERAPEGGRTFPCARSDPLPSPAPPASLPRRPRSRWPPSPTPPPARFSRWTPAS